MWFQLHDGGSKLLLVCLLYVPKHIYLDTNHTSAFSLPSIKGTVFFFPRNSLFFRTFRKKSSECVKKPFFFFPRPEKKKQPFQMSEWVACKLFLGKKKHVQKSQNHCFFFFPLRGKKKTTFSNSSEWVTPKLFRGKKKTVPLHGKKKHWCQPPRTGAPPRNFNMSQIFPKISIFDDIRTEHASNTHILTNSALKMMLKCI